jgi:hypothetical protein
MSVPGKDPLCDAWFYLVVIAAKQTVAHEAVMGCGH